MWMLTGAKGYTMAHPDDRFSGVVIDGEQIVAVGDSETLRLQYAHQLEKVVDVDGATILPGFIDSHVHLSWLGMQMDALDLHDAKSSEDVLRRVREKASTLPENHWVIGANWDENQFQDGLMPTLAELDNAALGRPVLLRRICGHVVFANKSAFLRAGVGFQPTNPPGGHFGRTASGDIDGFAYEAATQRLESGLPKADTPTMTSFVKRAMESALAAGITAVHTEDVRFIDGLAKTMAIYRNLQDSGVRLRIHQLVGYDYLSEYGRYLHEVVPTSAYQTQRAWLEAGAVKLFSDGSLGGRTAFLSSPYSDDPATTGMAIFTQEELTEHVREVRKLDLPVAIHAIGDGAVDRVLTAIESVSRASRRDRLIHAEVLNPSLLARMARLAEQVIIDAQPRFAASDLPWAGERLGAKRLQYLCAWKSMIAAGLRVCGGSDAPVEPISPLLGIHAAVTRQLPDVPFHNPRMREEVREATLANQSGEALTPFEAALLYTVNPPYPVHREQEMGMIQVGRKADLVVLDGDIVGVPSQNADEIAKTKVLQTIVGGQIAYDTLR